MKTVGLKCGTTYGAFYTYSSWFGWLQGNKNQW